MTNKCYQTELYDSSETSAFMLNPTSPLRHSAPWWYLVNSSAQRRQLVLFIRRRTLEERGAPWWSANETEHLRLPLAVPLTQVLPPSRMTLFTNEPTCSDSNISVASRIIWQMLQRVSGRNVSVKAKVPSSSLRTKKNLPGSLYCSSSRW